jgi:hypothetical protein
MGWGVLVSAIRQKGSSPFDPLTQMQLPVPSFSTGPVSSERQSDQGTNRTGARIIPLRRIGTLGGKGLPMHMQG